MEVDPLKWSKCYGKKVCEYICSVMKHLVTISYSLLKHWLPPVALLVAIWYGLAFFLRTTRQVPFPLPGETISGMIRLLANRDLLLNHSLYEHIAASFQRWLSGYAIGVSGGIGIGMLITLFPPVRAALLPLVSFVHLVPGLAWIPVAILTVGIGNRTAIMLIALTTLPPVTISLTNGMASVSREFIMVSRMCGDCRWQRFFFVQLPATLPYLLTGLRLGLANSWRVVVAAEMVIGTGLGLGYSIIQARWTLDYIASFICIGCIVIFGLLADYGLFGLLERLTVRRWGMTGE